MSADPYEQLAIWSQVVASVLFLVVLVYLWYRFVAPAVVASQARKNAELAEAEARRDAAKGDVELAQREVASAGTDVSAIRTRAERDALALRERIVNDARADGQRTVRNAEGELARGRDAARDQLRSDLLDRAFAIAREHAAQLDDSVDRRLIGDTLRALERGGPA